MIKITNKYNCCGCNACGDICPTQAISFKTDEEGFWYPEVDQYICVDCHLCEKVCPFLNDNEVHNPISVYAAINSDAKVRRESSSGGIFWARVNKTINESGLVFGASFDEEWQVCHSLAVTIEDAKKFQGSKYVQSRVSGCYKQVKEALKKGRKVLFSGTACQVSALKRYLGKDYDNLLTIDVVCHGVPSPGIWNSYLNQISRNKTITDVGFRDKQNGWKNYEFSVRFFDGSELRESHHENLFMQGYLHNLYLRPSCHACKVKDGRCGSDITLGDFWGVERIFPQLNDDLGASVILANTVRGNETINSLAISLNKIEYEQVVKENPCVISSSPESKWRSVFMQLYKRNRSLKSISVVLKQLKPSFFLRLINRVKMTVFRKKL